MELEPSWPCWEFFSPFWLSVGSLGPMLTHLRHYVGPFGPNLAYLGPMLAHLDANLAQLGANMARHRPNMAQHGLDFKVPEAKNRKRTQVFVRFS